MPIPLGILAVAGAGAAAGPSMQLIQTITASSGQSISFTNLASQSANYKHLQIRCAIRVSGGSETIRIQMNGVTTGGLYSYHYFQGAPANSSGVTNGGSSGGNFIPGTFLPRTTNVYAGVIIEILDAFSTTRAKTLRIYQATPDATDSNVVWFGTGVFDSTSSISSIDLLTGSSASFASNSRFSIYGIKG